MLFRLHLFSIYLSNICAVPIVLQYHTFKSCFVINSTYQKMDRLVICGSVQFHESWIIIIVVAMATVFFNSPLSLQLQLLCNDEVVNPLSSMKYLWIAHWRRKVKRIQILCTFLVNQLRGKSYEMSRIFGEKRSKPSNVLAYHSKSPHFSIIVQLIQ